MSPVLIKGLVAAGGIGLGGVSIWQMSEQMRPKTLQQKLELDGESFYPFDDDQQLSGWKSLAQKYKGGNVASNADNALPGVNITNTGEQVNDDDAKALRTACRAIADKGMGEENEEKNIKKLRDWCIVPKALAQTETGRSSG